MNETSRPSYLMVFSAFLSVVLLGVFFTTTVATRFSAKAGTGPWLIEPREQLALNGISQGYQALVDGLAPVVTSTKAREEIIHFLVPKLISMERAQEDLLASVKTRLHLDVNVALVVSNAHWERKK